MKKISMLFFIMAGTIFFSFKNKSKIVVPVAILFIFIISNMYLFFLGGGTVFSGFANIWDNGDFVLSVSGGLYTRDTICASNYPPLAAILFIIIQKLTLFPDDTVNEYALNYSVQIYLVLMVIVLVAICQSFCKKNKYANLIVISMFFSSTMLFAIQRMNLIILAFACLMIFLNYYESDNRAIKIVAMLMLAVSANLKYYPAIFGILLIKRKKWKEAVICATMGILLFIIPMFFSTDSNIFDLIRTTSEFADIDRIMGRDMSVISLTYQLLSPFGVSSKVVKIICGLAKVLIIIWNLSMFFLTERKDTELLSLGLLCVMCITASSMYNVLFLIPAYFEYLKTPISTKIDYLFNIVWILLLGYFWGIINIYYIQSALIVGALFAVYMISGLRELRSIILIGNNVIK